jgi:hypothetical protein
MADDVNNDGRASGNDSTRKISKEEEVKVLCHICGRRNNEEFFIFGREKVQMAHSLLFIR